MKDDLIKFYSRKDVQEEIFKCARGREFSIKFGIDSFGKRPDSLEFSNDILEFIKSGATSFHISEEHWKDPLQLKPGMPAKQLNDLRTGWDLIIDVDCKFWDYSKYITNFIINALRNHGIKSIGCKFSGNKGFHISVPFKSFPKQFNNQPIENLFPEAPRRIAQYLIDYIDSEETGYELSECIKKHTSEEDLIKYFYKKGKPSTKIFCKKCKREGEISNSETEFICHNCGLVLKEDKKTPYRTCTNCKKLMVKEKIPVFKCKHCKSEEFIEKFDMASLIDVDTLLISSRHLYRAPYSHHEKSGLISIPINPDNVLDFEKSEAIIKNINKTRTFFDIGKNGEASKLLIQAYDHAPSIELPKEEAKKEFGIPKIAIGEEHFPPAIKKILNGLNDGKKRSVFILLNFLRNVGWDFDNIEKLLKEWNDKNDPPLKWGYIQSQLSYQKRSKEAVLPPNYDNRSYYDDMGIMPTKEELKFKNPVTYAINNSKKKLT